MCSDMECMLRKDSYTLMRDSVSKTLSKHTPFVQLRVLDDERCSDVGVISLIYVKFTGYVQRVF